MLYLKKSVIMRIKLEYQVKSPTHLFSHGREYYEVRELIHECDPSKNERENLDDAFSSACELGAEPNKNIRWSFID